MKKLTLENLNNTPYKDEEGSAIPFLVFNKKGEFMFNMSKTYTKECGIDLWNIYNVNPKNVPWYKIFLGNNENAIMLLEQWFASPEGVLPELYFVRMFDLTIKIN